jgi:hypothetical protein
MEHHEVEQMPTHSSKHNKNYTTFDTIEDGKQNKHTTTETTTMVNNNKRMVIVNTSVIIGFNIFVLVEGLQRRCSNRSFTSHLASSRQSMVIGDLCIHL